MSLRARLLLAVGAVALVALVVAGAATYSATRSYLYGQVDQALVADCGDVGAIVSSGHAVDGRAVSSVAPGVFVELRAPGGYVLDSVPAVVVGGRTFEPLLPKVISLPGGASSGGTSFGAARSGGANSGGANSGRASSSRASSSAASSGAGSTSGGAASGGARSGSPLGGGQGGGEAYAGGGPGGPPPGGGAHGGGSSQPSVIFTAASTTAGGPPFRVRASALGNGYQEIVAIPLGPTAATLHHLALVEALMAALGLAVAGLAGWWLVRRGLRPLRAVESTAYTIAAGRLDQRVPAVAGPRTEVGRLAAVFNVMLDRIQGAFSERDATERALRASEEKLRRFLADASHELRTPLAAVSAYAELFERGADRRPADLARAMAGIRAETARMHELVEDLLLLARLDEGRALGRQPVELVALAAEAVQAAGAVAPSWPVRLQAHRPVEVIGDGGRLRQVLDNLLANVRAHTPEGTACEVRVSQSADEAVVDVVDHGPGLQRDEHERVFERFYRSDPSRARHHGGAGLGLAIVAGIVRAHRGTVEASATPGGGATFTVRLLLAPDDHRRQGAV